MKVDIIMRTKDRPLFLERAIKDVLAQSYKNWFLCIINDGGKASEVDKLVKKYKSHAKQIKVTHHAKSKGMEAASNAGIKSTNGELIVIHDDDDTWHPDFLKKCVAKLQEPIGYGEIGGVFTAVDMIFERVIDNQIKFIRRSPYHVCLKRGSSFLMTDLASHKYCIAPISFVFYRKCIDKVGYFDEKLPVCGDWDFYLRFMMYYDILYVDGVYSYYSVRLKSSNKSFLNSIYNNYDGLAKFNLYRNLIINKYIRDRSSPVSSRLADLIISSKNFHDNNLKRTKDLTIFIKINNFLRRIKNLFRKE